MKNLTLAFVVFLLISLIISACQPIATPPVSLVESDSSNQTQDSAPIEVTIWHVLVGTHEETFNKMVEEFNASHPDIIVKSEFGGDFAALHQKVMAALNAGRPPVIAMTSVPSMTEEYLKADVIVPIQKFIEDPEIGLSTVDVAEIFPAYIQEASHLVDGQKTVVSWPFTKSTPLLFYRTDHLQEAGFTHPPKTWTEMREYAKELTAMIGTPAFQTNITAIYELSSVLRAFGCEMISEDGTEALFNQQPCVDAVQLLADMALVDKTFAITSGFDHQNELLAGRASMFLGSSVSRVFMDQTVPYDIAPMPDETHRSATITGPNAVIFKAATEAQQRAAWEFLKWFTDADQTARFSIETGFVPVRTSASESTAYKTAVDKDSRIDTGLKQLPLARPMPATTGWERAQQALIDGIVKAVTGVVSPQEAMDEATQVGNAAIGK